MTKKLLIMLIFLLAVACKKNEKSLVATPIQEEENSFHTTLITNLNNNKIEGVTVNYIEGEKDLVLVVDYDKKNEDQVGQLTTIVAKWLPIIFSYSQVETVVFFYLQGAEFYDLRHFIQIDRTDYQQALQEETLPQTVFDWYNLASHYYIGNKITGDLSFKLGDIDVLLPVQKPIN